MLRRIRPRLSYANVVSSICLFAVLGGGAYAAAKLDKNAVKSKQIADGAIETRDLADDAVSAAKLAPGAVPDGSITSEMLADGAVTTSKLADGAVRGEKISDFAVENRHLGFNSVRSLNVAGGVINGGHIENNSIRGEDIVQSTLNGVDAAKIGGLEVKEINFRVPTNNTVQNILVYPGIFRIDAQCANFGDFIDISAATAVNDSQVSRTTMSTFLANDSDTASGNAERREIASDADKNFDANEVFEVDSYSQIGTTVGTNITVHYANPSGFSAVAHLQTDYDASGSGCVISGYSIGG